MSLLNLLLIELTVVGVCSQVQPFRRWARSFFCEPYFVYFLLPLLVIFGYPVEDSTAYVSGSALGWVRIARIVTFLCAFVWFMLSLIDKQGFHYPKSAPYQWYLGFVLVAAISASYSPDAIQTLWKAFELMVVLMSSAYLYRRYVKNGLNPGNLMQGVMYVVFVLNAAALVGGVVAPELAWKHGSEFYDQPESMRGVVPMINPNTLGQLGGMLAAYGTVEVLGKKRIKGDWLALGIGLLVLLFAYSRTSIIGYAMFALGVVIYYRGLVAGIAVVGTVVTIGLIFNQAIMSYLARGQSEELFMSMSGRTATWEIALATWLEQPLLGTGYYAGHKQIEDFSGGFFATLDSTYVETLVDVGIVGVIILSLFMMTTVIIYSKTVTRVARSAIREFVMAGVFLWFVIVRSFTASTYQTLHLNLLLLMLVVAYVVLVYRRNYLPSKKKHSNALND